ncbi:MAG: hypothetical protein ABIO49_14125 [Dokdonella sp.]
MRKQFVYGVLAMTALMCGAVSHASAPPHPGRHELRAEKHGRIVDADTGAGIPDAKVIAVWRQHSSGVSDMVSGGSWCNLQRIVVTDSDGRYMIPDVSRELDESETRFGSLSWNKSWSGWQLIVFKPDYIRTGKDYPVVKSEQGNSDNQQFTLDDRKVLDHRINGGDRACLPNQGCMPAFVWQARQPETSGGLLGHVDVQTIEMKKAQLSPNWVWVYYSTILTTGICPDGRGNDLSEPAYADIAKAMAYEVRPMACTLPPETSVDPISVGAFAGLSHPGPFNVKFINRVKELTGLPVSRQFDPLEKTRSTAEVLCRVVKEEESQ